VSPIISAAMQNDGDGHDTDVIPPPWGSTCCGDDQVGEIGLLVGERWMSLGREPG
jgi:hypothetical protein